MADLIDAALAGEKERATKAFAEREAPFVAMADDDLRTRLVLEAIRLSTAIDALGSSAPAANVSFAGRRLDPAELTMHGRSEAAVHRWDLAGDDDVSEDLLAQPELTAHAVHVLNTMLDASPEAVHARVCAAGITDLRAAFAAPGQPDVVLVVHDGGARLELGEPRPRWAARSDAATRLLALWGRRSIDRRVEWCEDGGVRDPFAGFLWGAGATTLAAAASSTALSETR